jgi:hypothetical protein
MWEVNLNGKTMAFSVEGLSLVDWESARRALLAMFTT